MRGVPSLATLWAVLFPLALAGILLLRMLPGAPPTSRSAATLLAQAGPDLERREPSDRDEDADDDDDDDEDEEAAALAPAGFRLESATAISTFAA